MTACPLCTLPLDSPLSSCCECCDLWWLDVNIASHHERLEIRPVVGDSGDSLQLMWERPSPFAIAVLLSFAVLGYGAAMVGLASIWIQPMALIAWVSAIIGVSLGGWVGSTTLAIVLLDVLRLARPSSLDFRGDELRVRVWRTWGGLWEAFRRTDVDLRRDQVIGVSLGLTQGMQTQLYLVHQSGHEIGLGWHGSREDALLYAQPILRWIEQAGR